MIPVVIGSRRDANSYNEQVERLVEDGLEELHSDLVLGHEEVAEEQILVAGVVEQRVLLASEDALERVLLIGLLRRVRYNDGRVDLVLD